jgi:hypothetical protein
MLESILTKLPSVLIGWKYPPRKIAASFYILLPKPDALQLTLQGAHSRFTLSLMALNLSPLRVDIERLDVSISVANQPLQNKQILYDKRVQAYGVFPSIVYGHRGMGTDLLYFNNELDSARADAAAAYAASQKAGQFMVQLRVEVYGRCKTGRIERRDISFDIPPGAAGIYPN